MAFGRGCADSRSMGDDTAEIFMALDMNRKGIRHKYLPDFLLEMI